MNEDVEQDSREMIANTDGEEQDQLTEKNEVMNETRLEVIDEAGLEIIDEGSGPSSPTFSGAVEKLLETFNETNVSPQDMEWTVARRKKGKVEDSVTKRPK